MFHSAPRNQTKIRSRRPKAAGLGQLDATTPMEAERCANQHLGQYLEAFPVLQALYAIKQHLMNFLLLKTVKAKRARRLLPRFLTLIQQLVNSPARPLAETLQSWLVPIVRMWRFSKSNGMTEGFHTKMEMITRRAFGFRNFLNYRMRVLALCGWNGMIYRV